MLDPGDGLALPKNNRVVDEGNPLDDPVASLSLQAFPFPLFK